MNPINYGDQLQTPIENVSNKHLVPDKVRQA